MAVSETPWSKFSAAGYSVEQWHRACIVHDHEGPATSKNQCKLPVREPDGTLNRAGVHAAAAALSGARGGVKLSVSERITSNRALVGHYKQLGEKPPKTKKPAFLMHDDSEEVLEYVRTESTVDAWLAHHGIKGMRWGIRRERTSDGTVGSKIDSEHSDPSKMAEDGSHGGGGTHLSADAERVVNTLKKTDAEMSTREMKEAVERHRQLEAYNKLFNPHSSTTAALQAKVEALRLEKDYRILKRELKPPSTVSKLIKTASAGFSAFKQIDNILGGNLSKGLTRKLGLVQTSPLEKLKAQTSLFSATSKNIEAKAELAELTRLHKAILAESNHASSAPAASKTAAPAKTAFGGKHKQKEPTHINDLSKPLKGPKHKR